MKLDKEDSRDRPHDAHRASIHGHQQRMLEAIFRHPTASNLGWKDVVEFVGKIGSMDRTASGEYELHVGGKHHLMHKPHTKDLTASELIGLWHFLQQAGWSPEPPSEADAPPVPAT